MKIILLTLNLVILQLFVRAQHQEYYKSGQLKNQWYEEGYVRHGAFQEWNEDGTLKEQNVYEKGHLIKQMLWRNDSLIGFNQWYDDSFFS